MKEEVDIKAFGNGARPSGHSIVAKVFHSPAQTAYRQRFGEEFRGPIIPFGAAIEYKTSSQKGLDDMPKMGTKLRTGIFAGYNQHAGGG